MLKYKDFKTLENWKNARQLGGSDAAIILLNDNGYTTIQELYDHLRTGTHKETTSDFAEYGHIQEPLIREQFFKDNLQYELKFYKPYALFTSDIDPLITASVDGIIKDTSTGELGLLEIKTRQVKDISEWNNWKDPRFIKVNYIIQVAHYLNVIKDLNYCVLAIKLDFMDKSTILYKSFTREHLKPLCEYVLNKELEFIKNLKNSTRPALDIFDFNKWATYELLEELDILAF